MIFREVGEDQVPRRRDRTAGSPEGGRGRRLIATMPCVQGPTDADDWYGLTDAALPISAAYEWAVQANCGAVVLFSGTVRDHAEGRDGVKYLTYEAYTEQVVSRFSEIGTELRRRWPDSGRIVLLHRTGRLEIGDAAVVVVAASAHRAEAFEACRFAIDTLKQTVPIWKKEVATDGEYWVDDHP